MSISVTVEPTLEPIDILDVKRHLRITNNDSNMLLETYLKAARMHAEEFTGRAFVQRTYEQKFDAFSDEMWLRRPPLQSVSSVKYIDTSGVEQTLSSDNYDVDTASIPGRINLAYNKNWPTIRDQVNAVTVTFIAGYQGSGSPQDLRANIPHNAILAMLLLIGHFYENRETTIFTTGGFLALQEIPMGYDSLLWPLRVFDA